MEQDTKITPVIFRKFKNGDVIALFPTIQENPYPCCLSYMHVGQHGAANYYELLKVTTPAAPAEYKDLQEELIMIGYTPVIYKRVTLTNRSKHYQKK